MDSEWSFISRWKKGFRGRFCVPLQLMTWLRDGPRLYSHTGRVHRWGRLPASPPRGCPECPRWWRAPAETSPARASSGLKETHGLFWSSWCRGNSHMCSDVSSPSSTWSYTRSSQVMTRSNWSLQLWKRSGRVLMRLLRSNMCKIPFWVYLRRISGQGKHRQSITFSHPTKG